jgi:uncharacterized protein YndB with AHSA1/START domain
MNRPTFDPGPLAEVRHETGDGRHTLVFVRELRHSPAKVWAALTDPAQLREWAPYTADRDLGSAGEATVTMIDGDVAEDLPASVLRAEPPTLLEYTLGTELLRWELTPAGAGTTLTLRQTVQGPEWVPMVAAGWHICLVVAERLLDGQPIGPIRGQDARNYGWDELNKAYADKFGLPVSEPPEPGKA